MALRSGAPHRRMPAAEPDLTLTGGPTRRAIRHQAGAMISYLTEINELHLQTARPQSVEPDPEQAVDREPPTTESAGNNRNDGTHELEHAGNTATLRRPIPKL